MDAKKAVEAAGSWVSRDPEIFLEGRSGAVNIAIPDDRTQNITSTLEITTAVSNFVVESVVAYIKLKHPARGDLSITLISPSGTESELALGGRPENHQLEAKEEWKLMSLRTWGEVRSQVITFVFRLCNTFAKDTHKSSSFDN